MGFIIGVLVLLIGLVFSVGIHELGHLLPAKRFGAGVPQYAIGFGPTLWKKQIGSTSYQIKAILLGGFVRILGMLRPTPIPSREGKQDSAQVIEARTESAKEIADHPNMKPFYLLKWWQKVIVMFGGPFTNLVLAVIFTTFAFSVFGTLQPTLTLEKVTSCQATSATVSQSEAQPKICAAHEAGLAPGDTIQSWNGQELKSWHDLSTKIYESTPNQPVKVTYVRNGTLAETEVTPQAYEGHSLVGIAPHSDVWRISISGSMRMVWDQMIGTAGLIMRLPQAVYERTTQIFGYNLEQKNVPLSVVGVVSLGGKLGSNGGDSVTLAMRIPAFLSLLGSLNIALFVFNLIPLLPLDGGHILGALFEGARGFVSKKQGKPDPGAADMARLVPLSLAVAGLLLVMTVILMVADIVAPLV
ncbi:hypothetical protein BK816_05230 [Boudabousia tangfeifanii]|uniref:Peptidase M50 domain-containing protein n=1 Tax=Boudabousia tangfeifanii TaxID=1912795 RepID=A0A1D9MKL4_9ACTO|nr:M50 family metallopeptidase [Boudabousia tangfeifanii]AOZ72768.1 hypothetical protein BK816_05230 [Boudabousia tangfeifanii]